MKGICRLMCTHSRLWLVHQCTAVWDFALHGCSVQDFAYASLGPVNRSPAQELDQLMSAWLVSGGPRLKRSSRTFTGLLHVHTQPSMAAASKLSCLGSAWVAGWEHVIYLLVWYPYIEA